MTERGLPPPDGTAACPFVAFDDDRDERSDRPDHRHRCYADVPPAPRAIAHQEAYCLASAFPVCPTFQAWARREAARSRDEETSSRPADSAPVTPAAGGGDADTQPALEWLRGRDTPVEDEPTPLPPRRTRTRDWAAPPPWAGGAPVAGRGEQAPAGSTAGTAADATAASAAAAGAGSSSVRAERTDGRGLAGSAADRLARGEAWTDPEPAPAARPQPRYEDARAQGPDEGLANLVARHAPVDDRDAEHAEDAEAASANPRPSRRPTVSSTRSEPVGAPSWEPARRAEAYPVIKSRSLDVSLPGLPRIAVLGAALAIAALALFFLPALLGIGEDGPAASPTPEPTTAVATASPEPTEPPAPTPQVYVIRQGDTLSKVADSFGISLDDLLEANRERIADPDRIAIGDEIIIPIPPPEEIVDPGVEESPEP